MTKKSCRRTMDENKIHEKAVKMRKKTDEQLVLETLKAFTCENIAMNFLGPKMPAVVEAEDSDMKAIVLPVMIREE